MDKPDVSGVANELMRELRNDFTFFVTMSVLKTMAVASPDAKQFMRDIVWKWREAQVTALGSAAAELEKKMLADEMLKSLFGDLVRKYNKAQREILVTSIRTFCDTVEKLLVTSVEDGDAPKEEGEFQG